MCAGAPNIPLLILVGILWFWLWLRLMALRLHDINRSAKWLLVLWLLPAVLAAAGGGQQMITLGGGLFWIVALLLNVVPGTAGDAAQNMHFTNLDFPMLNVTVALHMEGGNMIIDGVQLVRTADNKLRRRSARDRSLWPVGHDPLLAWAAWPVSQALFRQKGIDHFEFVVKDLPVLQIFTVKRVAVGEERGCDY